MGLEKTTRWASPDTSPNSPPFFYIQMFSEMCLFVGSPRILLRFLARVKTHGRQQELLKPQIYRFEDQGFFRA